ncbi:MAG: 2-oxoacid:acceptor oxidoreductase family protein [Gammaproteobacteria bacterium]|nr:2-oxoacid:acceptor oxidoreductase family protein [Gammaproteobacteria bacterium]
MLEIVVQGRGGQGAQTAGNLLAHAFFAEGRFVQTFATYGGARRGTPVFSFLRVDDAPIRLRCNIERPHAILCFDDSLLDARLLAFARPETPLVVNSEQPPGAFASLGDYRVLPVDAIGIARDTGMGRIVNSALLGAVAAVLEAPAPDTLETVLREQVPVKPEQNVRACREGFAAMRARLDGQEDAA